MQIDHPEYILGLLAPALIILVTAVIVIKKWGPEKFEDEKH